MNIILAKKRTINVCTKTCPVPIGVQRGGGDGPSPPPGQGPEGAMARWGGQGREIISQLSITITQETFENMYVFFLIGGGGRGKVKAIINFILFLLTKIY